MSFSNFLKWSFVAVVALLSGFYVFLYFSSDRHKLPPNLPPGAFALAFKNGVRAIMIDIEDQRFNEFATRRKYVASPVEDLPPWFEGAWAFCKPPTEEEWEELNRLNSNLDMQGGMRLEALCKIEVDYESFTTSVIFSVPDL